jgi:hypothetical protein
MHAAAVRPRGLQCGCAAAGWFNVYRFAPPVSIARSSGLRSARGLRGLERIDIELNPCCNATMMAKSARLIGGNSVTYNTN